MTAIERHGISLQLDVVFRPAEKRDLPRLEWYGQYTHFRRVFQHAYEDQLAGRRLMLLADVGGWPIGQIFMHFENTDNLSVPYSKRGYLYSLRVMDAFQGRGVGTALLYEAEMLLAERGYASISIACAKENPGARRLYERLGYRVFMEDSGRWQYVDHEGRTRRVSEPCWVLEKMIR